MSAELCCICHEELTENIYELPECNHKFHTNCICTWFRTGKNTCPLCNHNGVNGPHNTQGGWWAWKDKYKEMRKKSRKKDAPNVLKKLVKDLKKYELELKNHSKLNKDYKNSLTENEKVNDIISKYNKLRLKRHRINRKIRVKKRAIASLYAIEYIIIPEKLVIN